MRSLIVRVGDLLMVAVGFTAVLLLSALPLAISLVLAVLILFWTIG
jgi:predicted anti-sigma-YlaC factor YlaD